MVPLQRASERSDLVKELVASGKVYHPLAWSPREAYRFLQDVPIFEESGLIVRLPDWWKPGHPPRPAVRVQIDGRRGEPLTAGSLLEFSVNMALDGETLTPAEIKELLASVEGLVQLKGKWVEVDREQLTAALAHWQKVAKEVRKDGLTFFQGMRMLSGVPQFQIGGEGAALTDHSRAWTGLTAGPMLEAMLSRLRAPDAGAMTVPPNCGPSCGLINAPAWVGCIS